MIRACFPRRLPSVLGVIALVAFAVPVSTSARAASTGLKPTVVLVHGAWADASSWSAVVRRLQGEGYTVDAPPNPLRGLVNDAAYLATYLKTIGGPIVLVGHSYGGVVITNGAVGDSQVKALVYIDAFIPDAGENLLQHATGSCLNGDPTKIFNPVPSPGGVDLYIKNAPDLPFPGFDECFANGVPPQEAAVLAAVQRPLALNALVEPSGIPAWRTIPSWSLIGTEDHAVTPAEQESMSNRAHAQITRVASGHLSLVSHPEAVTDVITAAANATA